MLNGERIKSQRLILGLSQQELADRISSDQNRVSKYERGESDANGATIVALAKALGISADYLLGLSDSKDIIHPTLAIKLLEIQRKGRGVVLKDRHLKLDSLVAEAVTVLETKTAEQKRKAIEIIKLL